MTIRVERKRSSYNFKADPLSPDSFENNWKNNSQDMIIIRSKGLDEVRFHCQTVANYCFGDYATGSTVAYGDTIAPGNFKLRAFVPSRSFHGEIHAITHTKDIDGEWIDRDGMQITKGGFQNGRFLIHDRFSFKTGSDTNYAWSAGCFILSSVDLVMFNKILRAYHVMPGDLIDGLLVDV